jgi:hypothetical protein
VNDWSGFVRHVHHVFQEAFAVPGTEPDAIAAAVLRRLQARRNRATDREALLNFLRSERQVAELVHYTPLDNVPHILRFGLVPRAHLMIPAVRMALNPRFTDAVRDEDFLEKNCLSISFPNWKLFFFHRQRFHWQWAVLRLDPAVAAEFVCEFMPTNAAHAKVQHRPGIEAARRVFSGEALRRKLGLASHEATDPQAEVLTDSVIPPSMILEVCVESESARQSLASRGVEARVDPGLFAPRRDHAAWPKRASFLGDNEGLPDGVR